jgi:RimJ/RimL family protein N-acetyltransferase
MPAFLETDRLVLRGFTEADADHLYELNSDHDVMWFLSGGEPTPREEVRDRIIPFFLSFYERYEGLGTGGFGGPVVQFARLNGQALALVP